MRDNLGETRHTTLVRPLLLAWLLSCAMPGCSSSSTPAADAAPSIDTMADGAKPSNDGTLPTDTFVTSDGPVTPGTWIPPIGIPAPAFGIEDKTPEFPSPWTAEQAGVYYVDNTHAAATDNNNPYGTPQKPRASIPKKLAAGAVVHVRGGPYAGDLSLSGVGTAAQPIFVSGGTGQEPMPVIDGHVGLSGSYLLFEHLTLDGAKAGLSVATPSDHIAVRYCEIKNAVGGPGAGLYTGRWNPEDDPAVASHIVFFANRLHDLGDYKSTIDEDHHGVGIGHHAEHIWIVDNEMSHVSGDAVQVNAKKAKLMDTLHHVYIGGNRAWENKQTGFWVKQATDVIVSQNTIWGMRPSNSSEGSGLGFQYGPERIWFLYNRVYDCENGIKSSTNKGDEDGVVGTGKDVYIIGNVFFDIHKTDGSGANSDPWQFGSAIRLTDQTATKHVVGNTVYDVDIGISYPRGTGPLVLADNLLAKVGGQHVLIETSQAAQGSTLATSLFDPKASIRWGSSKVHDLASFKAAFSGQCSGCIEAAAAFKDAAKFDFHLEAASPAVDQGGATDVYSRFETLYKRSIRVDFDGIARPQGAASDIGAFER